MRILKTIIFKISTKMNKLNHFYLILFSLLFSANTLFAQEMNVTGNVVDDAGEALPGVSIIEKGTTNGVVTDVDGNYSIKTKKGNILSFSYIGFVAQEVRVENAILKVTLSTASLELEEVVAIGYGTQRRRDITGSVSSVNNKDIENRVVTNVGQALQGMVPGLNIVNTNGSPGAASMNISIRGFSTLSSNPVLVIIDGIPSSLDKINTNDIESISVLKDAASAAIYGSRATGGVILIKTKSGYSGKMQINYAGTVSIQSPSRFAEKISSLDHALLSNEARANDGLPAKYNEEEIELFRSSDYKDTDWEDFMFRDAFQTNHNINLTGGNASHNYYVSFGYLKQDGIVINSDYEQFNIQANHNFNILDKIKIGFRGSYIPSTKVAPGSISFDHIAQKPKTHAIISPDGKWLQHPEATGIGRNPMALAAKENGHDILKNGRFSGYFSLDYDIILGLQLSATYGVIKNNSRQRNYQARITYYQQYNPTEVASDTDYNTLSIRNISSMTQNTSLFANYSKDINNHKFMVMAGMTNEWFGDDNDYLATKDFLTENLYAISAGSTDKSLWSMSGTATDWALISYISRITYSFKDKYHIGGTIRYDGSSRFKKDKRWGLFPSVSVGWIVTEEDFIKDNNVLTFLKLRASWGQVGNQNATGYYPFADVLAQSSEYFNESPQQSVRSSGTPNPLLSWETKSAFNIGLDGSFFSNIIEFNIDVFKERTSDILLNLPVPTTYGLSAPVQNAATVDNIGWELELRHRNTIGDFRYGVWFQISDATNKVKSLSGLNRIISDNKILEEGYPMNEWYGYKALRIFQTKEEVANSPFQNPITSPGDLKFQENGGSPETIDSDDRIRLGRSDSQFPFGVKVNLSYKNFDFLAFGQGVMTNFTLAEGTSAQAFNSDVSTLRTYHLDRWTPENPNARFPKLRNGQSYTVNSQFSSFWLQNSAYFRLKQIELGYTFSQRLISKIKLSNLRVFTSAENLFVMTNYLGYDPELPNAASYPLPKLVNFGVNLSF
jgi:TonB-linked SusC/RagA family outer membrane protein